MLLARAKAAPCPRFGRGPRRQVDAPSAALLIGTDLKLFATTFIAGFIFVSILIG